MMMLPGHHPIVFMNAEREKQQGVRVLEEHMGGLVRGLDRNVLTQP